MLGSNHLQMQGADPVALNALEPQLDRLEPQPLRHGPQLRFGCAGVEERCKQHVPCQPTDAVEVGDHSRPLAIRAAIVPAPRPSSIPTTASAAAHEVSIAFSAVWPWRAIP